MKKEKAKELSELLKAYSEGKTIQFLVKQGWAVNGVIAPSDTWVDIKVENINYKEFDNEDCYKYRIKPEPKLSPHGNSSLKTVLLVANILNNKIK